VKIRDATPDDAEAACAVLRASIIELCAADHGNDPALLERWLANKRPEIVAGWIGRPEHPLLVAVDSGGILAVGALAFELGNTECWLQSTETAHRFYLSNGYVDTGEPIRKFGMNSGYPMSKPIRPR